MTSEKRMYRCELCEIEEYYNAEEEEKVPPQCCGKEMVKVKLPLCTSAEHAEMVRNEDDNGPCDDGRGKAD